MISEQTAAALEVIGATLLAIAAIAAFIPEVAKNGGTLPKPIMIGIWLTFAGFLFVVSAIALPHF
jgi:hypothetical protein